MPELSLSDIEQIAGDIRRQEISFSLLLEDLIDHVCCDVENEMQKGLNFSEAYRRVKQKMGSRRIKEIQEETLYAVDTKYRYMKNTPGYEGMAEAAPIIFDLITPSGNDEAWTLWKFNEDNLAWVLIYLDGLKTNLKMLKVSQIPAY